MGLTASNYGLFRAPGFIFSLGEKENEVIKERRRDGRKMELKSSERKDGRKEGRKEQGIKKDRRQDNKEF